MTNNKKRLGLAVPEMLYVKLKEKFEDEYGPLLSKDADSPVQWIKGPWPWEVQ